MQSVSKKKTVINKIYDEHYSWLIQRAYLKVNDISVCEDMFNDCVVGWIKNIDALERLSDRELKTYAARSIDSACHTYLKRSKKMFQMLEENHKPEFFEAEAQDVEALIETKYTYEVMKSSFKKLSEKERDAIIMKYRLRMKDREMASVMGIKENSVRMTVNRCVKKLGRLMKKEMK